MQLIMYIYIQQMLLSKKTDSQISNIRNVS